MNEQPTKLETAESNLKQLMADVSRAPFRDKVRIATKFGLAPAAPAGARRPRKALEAPLRLADAPALRLGLREFALDHGDQPLILLQAEHEVHAEWRSQKCAAPPATSLMQNSADLVRNSKAIDLESLSVAIPTAPWKIHPGTECDKSPTQLRLPLNEPTRRISLVWVRLRGKSDRVAISQHGRI
jgi:hypothetical protein